MRTLAGRQGVEQVAHAIRASNSTRPRVVRRESQLLGGVTGHFVVLECAAVCDAERVEFVADGGVCEASSVHLIDEALHVGAANFAEAQVHKSRREVLADRLLVAADCGGPVPPSGAVERRPVLHPGDEVVERFADGASGWRDGSRIALTDGGDGVCAP
jgi:hypothetical protein